jgi:hypothetical protein
MEIVKVFKEVETFELIHYMRGSLGSQRGEKKSFQTVGNRLG